MEQQLTQFLMVAIPYGIAYWAIKRDTRQSLYYGGIAGLIVVLLGALPQFTQYISDTEITPLFAIVFFLFIGGIALMALQVFNLTKLTMKMSATIIGLSVLALLLIGFILQLGSSTTLQSLLDSPSRSLTEERSPILIDTQRSCCVISCTSAVGVEEHNQCVSDCTGGLRPGLGCDR